MSCIWCWLIYLLCWHLCLSVIVSKAWPYLACDWCTFESGGGTFGEFSAAIGVKQRKDGRQLETYWRLEEVRRREEKTRALVGLKGFRPLEVSLYSCRNNTISSSIETEWYEIRTETWNRIVIVKYLLTFAYPQTFTSFPA